MVAFLLIRLLMVLVTSVTRDETSPARVRASVESNTASLLRAEVPLLVTLTTLSEADWRAVVAPPVYAVMAEFKDSTAVSTLLMAVVKAPKSRRTRFGLGAATGAGSGLARTPVARPMAKRVEVNFILNDC